ncbi:MAG: SH3 domain-containing protein [Clostridia bacterium]|nr:SH3 domain-containing protein [Clostridia bacterium]
MRRILYALCAVMMMFAAAAYAQEISPIDELLLQGWTLTDSDLTHGKQVYLLENGEGVTRLRIAQWNGIDGAYVCMDNDTVPQGAWLDDFHAGEKEILVHWLADGIKKDAPVEVYAQAERAATLAQRSDGTWYLRGGIDNQQEGQSFIFTACGIQDLLAAGSGCNDGVYYGSHPFMDAKTIDFAQLPVSVEGAFALLDRSEWAVVRNPDPEDRLNLREAPRRNANSMGKFFNRTPVRILSRRDGWCQVQVGGSGMTGWMMEEFLVFGEEMDDIKCVFESENGLFFRSEDGENVYEQPKLRSRSWKVKTVDYVIGVCGNDWRILMDEEGRTFYVPREKLWGGNG